MNSHTQINLKKLLIKNDIKPMINITNKTKLNITLDNFIQLLNLLSSNQHNRLINPIISSIKNPKDLLQLFDLDPNTRKRQTT